MESDISNDLAEEEKINKLGAINQLIGQYETETLPDRIDSLDEIFLHETYYQSLEFVKNYYALKELTPIERALSPLTQPMHSVSHIGNQFAIKIMPCFINEDPSLGWEDFKNIIPHTTDEELVLLVNEEQFNGIHSKLHNYLLENNLRIVRASNERLKNETDKSDFNVGRITANDRYQFNGIETPRSLENILKNGVTVSIDPNGLEVVQKASLLADAGLLPITEIVKNERVLGVNGFMSSKISLAVHDSMDHVWTFNTADKSGLLKKYQRLFDSVGNPEHTDIFKREGEMVASVGFGVRYWATMEHGFVPLVTCADLLKRMDILFDNNLLENSHMEAYKLLRVLNKNPQSREAQSLGFVFSNYTVELNEQRRKHGKIKQKDLTSKKIIGELDPFGPDYLSFFIELHHELLDSRNKHRNDLLRFHILLEEYLAAIGTGSLDINQALNVRVQELPQIDFSGTTLPPARINWLARNYGFSAIKDAII